MKKARILLGAALATTLSFGFVSCSSSNDDNSGNNNQVTDENVVADDASALSLVNGVYSHWQPLSSSFSFIIELNSNKLISFEGEESEAGPVNSRFEQDPTTWYQVKIFNHLFLGIAQDNEAITTIENSLKAGKVSQAGYNAAVGKAKFLRALAYLKLTQLWGEVPVFTEKGGSTTDRKSIDEVFAQIVSDLTDAESLLKNYDGDPRVPSKQAAEALLARAYLVWGDNPLSAAEVEAIANGQADPQFTKTDSRLEKAVEYANKVIASGLLKLDPDYTKLYGRDYESNKRGTNEHLFTIAHDGDKVDAQGNHQTHCSWTFPFQNGEYGNGYTQNHTSSRSRTLKMARPITTTRLSTRLSMVRVSIRAMRTLRTSRSPRTRLTASRSVMLRYCSSRLRHSFSWVATLRLLSPSTNSVVVPASLRSALLPSLRLSASGTMSSPTNSSLCSTATAGRILSQA